MGDMGMWGLSSNSPLPAPIPITSKPSPLITGRFDPRGDLPTSPRPISEPGTVSQGLPCAIQIFANLANLHPSRWRGTSHIMARVPQHLVVGERRP